MNCAVCGNPLLCSRAAFRCSCGVFVHVYCWDKHVLQAHQPAFEVGTIDLDGDFRISKGEIEQAPIEIKQAPSEVAQVPDEIEHAPSEMEQVPGEVTQVPDEKGQAPAEIEQAPNE